MDDQLYSRRCDVKKPQLTIGYSAAFTGEEKPRSGVGRGSAFREPCYASTNRRGHTVRQVRIGLTE